MGWKNVKEHYNIKHTVQVRNGRIAIGSPYVHDLIRVEFDGSVSWGSMGSSKNSGLDVYYADLTADPTRLKELIDAPDTFADSIECFTFKDGQVIGKRCEAFGYPNCTHDGELMYDNTFFLEPTEAAAKAKREVALGVKWARESLADAEKRVVECQCRLAEEVEFLAQLDTDWPEVTYEKP